MSTVTSSTRANAPLKNDTLIKALLCEPVERTPVWMMRQAGRYLPEYRATRQQAGGIIDLFRNPQLACEVTLQPLERFPLDAAILFSDILTIPDAMGLGLYFETGEGPRFKYPISNASDVDKLAVIKPTEDLPYVLDAVSLIRKELNGRVPLIGFSGSPWTLACYMVEGRGSKDFAKIKTMAFSQPQLMHELLSKLADSVIAYLNAQIEAGAQIVQVFDTWGGVLSDSAYQEFSLRYLEHIVADLHKEWDGKRIPAILFTKNGGQWLPAIATTGTQAVGLDWTTDIGKARQNLAQAGIKNVALQGNMDPGMLRAPIPRIRDEVAAILAAFGQGSGHVFNLGHGITPDIDPEHAGAFIAAVHEFSPAYH